MKKDRNCGASMYPVYPVMQQPQVMPIGMVSIPQQQTNMQSYPNYQGSIETQINNMSRQLSNLERRGSTLEGLVGNTGYNNSNFQMM